MICAYCFSLSKMSCSKLLFVPCLVWSNILSSDYNLMNYVERNPTPPTSEHLYQQYWELVYRGNSTLVPNAADRFLTLWFWPSTRSSYPPSWLRRQRKWHPRWRTAGSHVADLQQVIFILLLTRCNYKVNKYKIDQKFRTGKYFIDMFHRFASICSVLQDKRHVLVITKEDTVYPYRSI